MTRVIQVALALKRHTNKTMPRLYIQYQNNCQVPILTQTLPSVLQGEEPVVADLVAAYKTAVTPLLDHSSLAQLTLHTAIDGPAIPGNTLLIDIQQPVGSYEQPLIIKSRKDSVRQEPSPISSDRPITPEEEKHLQRLLSYIYKTDQGRCVTVFDEHTAVTYAHGSHSQFVTGDIMRISPVKGDDHFCHVIVKEINKARDYLLLHSETPLCQRPLTLKLPRIGVEYIQIGLSGNKKSPVIYGKGVIASDDFQNNKGFMLGSAGSSPGDSGSGIFHTSSLALFGIGTASMKKVTTDFERTQCEEEIGMALNDLALVASQPVFSYICPSNLFTGFEEPPKKKTKEDILDFKTSAY